jgi:hypothetical protein
LDRNYFPLLNERAAEDQYQHQQCTNHKSRPTKQPQKQQCSDDRLRLRPGDSLLAPRKVPHVWAYVGDTFGKILIVFTPAGKMEAFFREVTKADAMPPQDPGLWRARHGVTRAAITGRVGE